MKRWSVKLFSWAGAALACCLCLPAHSALVISNGGFEGGLTGWTTANLFDFPGGGSGSFFSQTGTTSPVLGEPVPAPPGGSFAAMTDAEGPGSHVLYQDFTVPASPVGTTFLSFDLFVGNRADAFHTPDHLDWSTPARNQQARVDLLDNLTDPFSLSASDVVLNAFRTNVGDPLVSGYTHFEVDVTAILNANLNTTLRLRFAEVDNVGPFHFGVDNVAFVTPAAPPPGQAPEPATLALLALALGGVALFGATRSDRIGPLMRRFSDDRAAACPCTLGRNVWDQADHGANRAVDAQCTRRRG